MPLNYVVPIGSTTGTLPVSRFFVTSFPLDWYTQVLANGPLPVVCFQHGGNNLATDFLFTLFEIERWWTGVFSPSPLKAIAIAIQGVSLSSEDGGGTWNGGNTGSINRLAYGAVPRGSYGIDEVADAILWGSGFGDWPNTPAAAGDVDRDCMPDLAVGERKADTVYLLRGGTF